MVCGPPLVPGPAIVGADLSYPHCSASVQGGLVIRAVADGFEGKSWPFYNKVCEWSLYKVTHSSRRSRGLG